MNLSDILNLINAWIPSEIAGIDSMYVAAAVIVVIVLIWIILKTLKKTPEPKDLADFPKEKTEQSDVDAEEVEIHEEDGFMPSTIPDEPQVDEEEIEADIEADVSVKEVVDNDEPLVQARKKRESTRNGRKITKADFADFNGKRLLIAEDNLINQKVLNGVLNESGIDVVMADDGQIALEILEKDSDFEIILMDAHMPRIDGFDATRAIRENSAYNHIVVAALSGDTASDDIRKMREAGMEEQLEKPLKMDALYDVMSMYYTMDKDAQQVQEEPDIVELEIDRDVSELQTLDYDLGVDICGGDENMYKQLLKEFFVGYKDSSKQLHKVLVEKDYVEAQHILIDVKGTASNLGSKQFINVVDRFLQALSQEHEYAYNDLFKEYQTYLLALLKSIQNAFKV